MVAQRIQEMMRNDPEEPAISASIGASTYYGDNGRIERLLSDADQNLYAQKSSRKTQASRECRMTRCLNAKLQRHASIENPKEI